MFPNAKPSELVAVLAAVNPSNEPVGNALSGWISAADFLRFLAIIQIGVLGNAATIDANFMQALDINGTGAKPIGTNGKAIAQVTAGNNQIALLNLSPAELDVNGGFAYIQLTVADGAAASFTSALLLGFEPRYLPPAQIAAVTQVV